MEGCHWLSAMARWCSECLVSQHGRSHWHGKTVCPGARFNPAPVRRRRRQHSSPCCFRPELFAVQPCKTCHAMSSKNRHFCETLHQFPVQQEENAEGSSQQLRKRKAEFREKMQAVKWQKKCCVAGRWHGGSAEKGRSRVEGRQKFRWRKNVCKQQGCKARHAAKASSAMHAYAHTSPPPSPPMVYAKVWNVIT